MRNIDSELKKAGAEFRNAGETLPERRWQKAADRWRPGRPLFAVALGATAVLLLAVPIALLGGGGSSDPLSLGAGVTEPPAQAVASSETTTTTAPVAAPRIEATLEDPPHLLLEAEGWEMVGYYEKSYGPYRSQVPLVLRPPGAGIEESTLIADVFEITDVIGWSAGTDAERIDLDGRVVSIVADSAHPDSHTAGIEFADGTLVVVKAYAMDRSDFVEAAKHITLDSTGDPIVTPPAGYAQVVLPAPYAETVTYRQAQYMGPGGASAEIRTWSGTLADVELDAFNRVREAVSVRSATIDGAAVVIANHTDDMSRVWVVGGDDGYVIEIDFNPFVVGASDADLDAVLSQIRLVDLVTFEAALPEGSVTSATMDTVVAEMLADIPQPTGFDAAAVGSTGSRYHVGAEVVGAVTCAWLDQWVDATAAGDTELADAAVTALGTSTEWSILLEMDVDGNYPEVVWEYAAAIANDGTVVGGRVLTVEESYGPALGCGE